MFVTTYFSKINRLPAFITPVSISLWPPKGYTGLRYPALAPTQSILKEYKNDPDWARYTRRYNKEVLAKLDPDKVVAELRDLAGSKDIALVCFERDSTQCHRSLVAAWLKEHGYDTKEFGL